MSFRSGFLAALGISVCWSTCLLAIADQQKQEAEEKPKEKEEEYVRLTRNSDDQPLALQTAIVSMSPKTGNTAASVDLIGAIHVADKSYYDQLNRRFRKYDAVLYELVAPKEANIPERGEGPGSMVGGMQVGVKSLLGLEFQLDWINYRRKNMVHADMSPEEFRNTMKARNESFMGMFFRMMGRAMAEQADSPAGSSDWQILAAMFAPDRSYRLKLIMAEEFADMEGQINMFDGPDGSTIITERNKKALVVLRRELDSGKQKLAIFYGAGHLPDLRKRLEEDFGFQIRKTTWVDAWSLSKKATSDNED